MALELDFDVTEQNDSKKFFFTDETGAYNASTNTGGYGGSVNPDTTDVTTVTISLTLPDGTTFLPTGATYDVDPSGSLPSTDDTVEFEITPTDIGLAASDKMPDGIYEIAYEVTGTFNSVAFTESVSKYIIFVGQVECCLDGLLEDLDPGDCGCDSKKKDIAVEAYTWLLAAKHAASCAQINNASKIMQYLDRICENSGCNEC